MKKILALFLVLISLGGITQCANASKIPDAELNIIQKAFPDAKVRFDGLVELSDGTSYIPVYPLIRAKKAISILRRKRSQIMSLTR